MLLKLALRNIRRSARDYAIYFVTLIFGVMLFYAFNSVESQQVLFDFESQATSRQFEMVSYVLSLFSGVIACVLGFLVIYANQFLIKRRKREFGTYLILGMRPFSVSFMVMIETVLVGAASLVIGLILGLLLSQGLSFLSAFVIGERMTQYRFVFSAGACLQTTLCFAVIFVLTLLFNVFVVNRYKLIDLIRSDRANEKGGTRNPWICLVVFLLSLGVIAYSYSQLAENGLVMLDDPAFMRATIAMLIGTLMFFWAAAGFVINVISHVRGVYLRGLVAFSTRQIAARINTAFLSLWAVCVLLFFSITTFSCGMGMMDTFVVSISKAVPFDITLQAQIWNGPDGRRSSSVDDSSDPILRRAEMQEGAPERLEQAESWDWSMAAPLEAAAPDLWAQTVGEFTQVDMFELPGDASYGTLIAASGIDAAAYLDDGTIASISDQRIAGVSLSQYNAVCAMGGYDPIELAPGSFAIANNLALSGKLAAALAESGVSIEVAGEKLTAQPGVGTAQLEDNFVESTTVCLVFPDECIANLLESGCIPSVSYLNVDYADNGKTESENQDAMVEIIKRAQPEELGGFDQGYVTAGGGWASLLWPVTTCISKVQMLSQIDIVKLIIVYLALYIGIVLLVCTAAVLAIQQLSQTTDSLGRYRTVWCLGTDRKSINRSLLAQVLIYFLTPLGLAICHAACAVSIFSHSFMEAFGGADILGSIMLASALVLVVYGSYMVITYFGARSMVASSLKQA